MTYIIKILNFEFNNSAKFYDDDKCNITNYYDDRITHFFDEETMFSVFKLISKYPF